MSTTSFDSDVWPQIREANTVSFVSSIESKIQNLMNFYGNIRAKRASPSYIYYVNDNLGLNIKYTILSIVWL